MTMRDFEDMVRYLVVDSDCQVCGFSWPGCQGACVAHVGGPYHGDFNDDCLECKALEDRVDWLDDEARQE